MKDKIDEFLEKVRPSVYRDANVIILEDASDMNKGTRMNFLQTLVQMNEQKKQKKQQPQDETPDGDLIQVDMTQILLNQEKYRRLLGDMNVQNILAQMHPTQSTFMDGMSDEERFNCVISRHCQTMSERQAVLQQLASEKSELTKHAEAMLAEQKSAPDSSSAPDSAAQ